MKEPRIAYTPPESKCWDLMMEYPIAHIHQVSIKSIQPYINTGDVLIYPLSAFCAAFNEEQISDQGVILQIIEE